MSHLNIKEIKEIVKEIENFTGLECGNIADLKDNATLAEWQDAYDKDKCWFRGYADHILTIT